MSSSSDMYFSVACKDHYYIVAEDDIITSDLKSVITGSDVKFRYGSGKKENFGKVLGCGEYDEMVQISKQKALKSKVVKEESFHEDRPRRAAVKQKEKMSQLSQKKSAFKSSKKPVKKTESEEKILKRKKICAADKLETALGSDGDEIKNIKKQQLVGNTNKEKVFKPMASFESRQTKKSAALIDKSALPDQDAGILKEFKSSNAEIKPTAAAKLISNSSEDLESHEQGEIDNERGLESDGTDKENSSEVDQLTSSESVSEDESYKCDKIDISSSSDSYQSEEENKKRKFQNLISDGLNSDSSSDDKGMHEGAYSMKVKSSKTKSVESLSNMRVEEASGTGKIRGNKRDGDIELLAKKVTGSSKQLVIPSLPSSSQSTKTDGKVKHYQGQASSSKISNTESGVSSGNGSRLLKSAAASTSAQKSPDLTNYVGQNDEDLKPPGLGRNMSVYQGRNYNWCSTDQNVKKLTDRYEVYVTDLEYEEAQKCKSVTSIVRYLVDRVYTRDVIMNATISGFPPRGKGKEFYANKPDAVFPRFHPHGVKAIMEFAREVESSKKSWRPKASDKDMTGAMSSRCCELKNRMKSV